MIQWLILIENLTLARHFEVLYKQRSSLLKVLLSPFLDEVLREGKVTQLV